MRFPRSDLGALLAPLLLRGLRLLGLRCQGCPIERRPLHLSSTESGFLTVTKYLKPF